MRAALIACVLVVLLAARRPRPRRRTRLPQFLLVGGPRDRPVRRAPATVGERPVAAQGGVFALRLRPVGEVIYPVTARARQRRQLGRRSITLENIPAGRYQIVLSEEAWVEAIQDNERLPLLPRAAVDECPRRAAERARSTSRASRSPSDRRRRRPAPDQHRRGADLAVRVEDGEQCRSRPPGKPFALDAAMPPESARRSARPSSASSTR